MQGQAAARVMAVTGLVSEKGQHLLSTMNAGSGATLSSQTHERPILLVTMNMWHARVKHGDLVQHAAATACYIASRLPG